MESIKRIFDKIRKIPKIYIILLSLLALALLLPEPIFAAGYLSEFTEIDIVKAIRLVSQMIWAIIILALHLIPFVLIVALVLQIFSFAKQLSTLSRIKKTMRENKRDFDSKPKIYYAGGLRFGLKARLRGRKNDINIVIIHVRRRYAKYHFNDPENVEIWCKKLVAFGSRNRAQVMTYGEWTQKGSLKLPKWESGENYAIFDSARLDITSDERGESPYRISGDRLFDSFTVYTADKFVEYIEKNEK